MFLYWKKRGVYELEALPPSLTQVGIERYSWSSSLDAIHDLCGKLGVLCVCVCVRASVCVCVKQEAGQWVGLCLSVLFLFFIICRWLKLK